MRRDFRIAIDRHLAEAAAGTAAARPTIEVLSVVSCATQGDDRAARVEAATQATATVAVDARWGTGDDRLARSFFFDRQPEPAWHRGRGHVDVADSVDGRAE